MFTLKENFKADLKGHMYKFCVQSQDSLIRNSYYFKHFLLQSISPVC